LSDEIRLAKQFFKANGFYGAESYINGFSGHVIDILVAYYGSFQNLLDAARLWKEKVCIDIKGFYDDESEILASFDKDKISDLVVVDPIIKTRNASRALSNEKYSEFILLVNNIDDLNEDYFVVSKPLANIIVEDVKNFARENNLRFLIYKFRIKTKDESEDIVGAKMLKLFGKVKKYFFSYDFKVFKDDFFIDLDNNVCLFIYLFEKVSLPTIKKIEGPKVYMKDAVNNFLEGKDRYFIDDGKVCVYEKRVVMKFKDIAKISVDDFQRLLNRDISFVKRVRIIK
jgi:tRNA nucleotidyltransferase (CCA-adding enzyme)